MLCTIPMGTYSMCIRARKNWMRQMDILDLKCSRGEEDYSHIRVKGW
jgi:chemotaxis methyl-accepting protein methylase